MQDAQTGAVGARLGNVEVAIFAEAEAFADGHAPIGAHFVVARRGSGGDRMTSWVDALEETDEERLLMALAPVAFETVQALLCWPETDALVYGEGASTVAALLRTAATRESARAFVASGNDDPAEWLASIGAEYVDRSGLGLGDPVEVR